MNRSKAFGKIKKRIEEAKNKWSRLNKVDFSYNESARFATDALLDGGIEEYQKVLNEEGEVDFLSGDEVKYILKNFKEPISDHHIDGENGTLLNGNKSESYYPMNSDNSDKVAPLHNWSAEDKPYLKDKSSATVYFQSDKANNIRDTIRRCIHRTSQNISVRSVTGEVYCAKSGKKFSGQIHENILILTGDVLSGHTESFTWLSGQVHRNFLYKFSGDVVELFDEEFRHLYGLSKPVMGLKSPAPIPVLRREDSGMSIMTDSTTESINTTSEPFSGSSIASISNASERPKSPETTTPRAESPARSPDRSPLLRMNSIHGYPSLMSPLSPPAQSNFQTNYYQRTYVPDSPNSFFNRNVNIYRSLRVRQEEFNSPGVHQGWRFYSRPTIT
ncbi:hypothetical protein GDO86_010701 [Hymenochirus boettgeri]|uniref:Scaffolding anchor of CK1 domain-containing protein n=1 Tax=Hymenochirus boettgeri TaxID=247094 RepID=A0A8T2JE78_9PIPI|nr:hypothetical protein GDO86_010701 [Hymenochirus boettgeri]